MSSASSNGPPLQPEDVWSYPRPPALESVPQRLRVIWHAHDGTHAEPVTIADTTAAYRVLETSHPPTYYLPSADVNMDLLRKSNQRQTMCEWKGRATYFDFLPPGSDKAVAKGRVWTYESPTPRFKPIAGYLSFYASAGDTESGEWKCYVGDELVKAQDGDFYGGWKTSNLQGKMKGGPGTWGW